VRAKTVKNLQIIVIVCAMLLGSGLLVHFYVTTDPTPDWWYNNSIIGPYYYPWLRFVTQLLLLAGVGTLLVGLVLESRVRPTHEEQTVA